MSVENHPGSLSGMPDDKLGAIAVGLVLSELKWTPDVTPSVMDRISRDAVAYPEHFDRRPAPPTVAADGVGTGRSASRTAVRIVVFLFVFTIVVALVFFAATANAASALGAEPETSSDGDAAALADPSAEPVPVPTFDPASVTIRIEPIASGFTTPVYLADDGHRRPCLYVVERGGTIRTLIDGLTRETPFLDISDRVSEGAEQGLHSVAFHPRFRRNGRFFVHYNDVDGHTRIDEFKGAPCQPTDVGTGKSILKVEQPRINNNAGWIGFGPDGFLYIPLGDGGGRSPGDPDGLGQTKDTLLSKVLRIDVSARKGYKIPKSNPFARKRKGFPRETWAWGLRDPRRASFDRETGDLWIGDVGEDRFEEVDRMPAGQAPANFGWSDVEGDQCHNLVDCDTADYVLPTHFYDSVSPHGGIVGGYVYRGEAIPELVGVYLFSDNRSGFIWGIDAAAVARGEKAPAHVLLDAPQGFVSFGQSDAGELHLVALDGTIYRIEAERA